MIDHSKKVMLPPSDTSTVLLNKDGLPIGDWQPIEAVPRDRYVLLYSPECPRWDGNMVVGKWFGEDEDYACFWSPGGPNGGLEIGRPDSPGHYHGGYNTPSKKYEPFTHWMDLPPDPKV